MATAYITVLTRHPEEVQAYLYRHTTVEFQTPEPNEFGSTAFVLKTVGDSDNTLFLAQYQADRLSSGLHGAKPFEDRTAAYRDLERVGFDNITIPEEN